jgi:hypothetical protein
MTWTKSAIREARKAELVPLLRQRGYRLQPCPNDNYTVLPDPARRSSRQSQLLDLA